jgi:hypothetical protein
MTDEVDLPVDLPEPDPERDREPEDSDFGGTISDVESGVSAPEDGDGNDSDYSGTISDVETGGVAAPVGEGTPSGPRAYPHSGPESERTDASSAQDQAASGGADLPDIPDVVLTKKIGEGGMGSVYRGRQAYIDREVAVKLLLDQGHKDFAARFQREAKILAGMTHANIVGCYQAGTAPDGTCYLVMEFIDGPNLREFIDEGGALSVDRALLVCRDVARALRHAQENEIIHRDVKPDNVLLQPDPRSKTDFAYKVKLADLGLARPMADDSTLMNLTLPGQVMGTPSTMSPEQFDDPNNVDFRTDIYGLGCVLYHALTGKVAFVGASISGIIAKKMEALGPDPRKVRKNIPKPVSGLVMKMLAKEPDERPASYEEVIASCEKLLRPGGRGAGAGIEPKWIAALAGGVALLALVLWFALGAGAGSDESKPQDTKTSVEHADAPEDEPTFDELVARMQVDTSGIDRTVGSGQGIELDATVTGLSEAEGSRLEVRWVQSAGDPERVSPIGPGLTPIVTPGPATEPSYTVAFTLQAREAGGAWEDLDTVEVEVTVPPIERVAVMGHRIPNAVAAGDTVPLNAVLLHVEREEYASLDLHWVQIDGAGEAPPLASLAGGLEATFVAPEHDQDYVLVVALRGGSREILRWTIAVAATPSNPLDTLAVVDIDVPAEAAPGATLDLRARLTGGEGVTVDWRWVGGEPLSEKRWSGPEATVQLPERDEDYTVTFQLVATIAEGEQRLGDPQVVQVRVPPFQSLWARSLVQGEYEPGDRVELDAFVTTAAGDDWQRYSYRWVSIADDPPLTLAGAKRGDAKTTLLTPEPRKGYELELQLEASEDEQTWRALLIDPLVLELDYREARAPRGPGAKTLLYAGYDMDSGFPGWSHPACAACESDASRGLRKCEAMGHSFAFMGDELIMGQTPYGSFGWMDYALPAGDWRISGKLGGESFKGMGVRIALDADEALGLQIWLKDNQYEVGRFNRDGDDGWVLSERLLSGRRPEGLLPFVIERTGQTMSLSVDGQTHPEPLERRPQLLTIFVSGSAAFQSLMLEGL